LCQCRCCGPYLSQFCTKRWLFLVRSNFLKLGIGKMLSAFPNPAYPKAFLFLRFPNNPNSNRGKTKVGQGSTCRMWANVRAEPQLAGFTWWRWKCAIRGNVSFTSSPIQTLSFLWQFDFRHFFNAFGSKHSPPLSNIWHIPDNPTHHAATASYNFVRAHHVSLPDMPVFS
jgi:hypothetical protein